MLLLTPTLFFSVLVVSPISTIPAASEEASSVGNTLFFKVALPARHRGINYSSIALPQQHQKKMKRRHTEACLLVGHESNTGHPAQSPPVLCTQCASQRSDDCRAHRMKELPVATISPTPLIISASHDAARADHCLRCSCSRRRTRHQQEHAHTAEAAAHDRPSGLVGPHVA